MKTASASPTDAADVPAGQGHRAWAAFVRQELMGPIEALVGLGELLGQEAAGVRPDDYLGDVRKLQVAAERLQELAGGLLARDEQATSAGLEAELGRARHDLGNRLNQVSGVGQLLQMQEEGLFGA